jgi:hypothetical protein
MRVFVAGVIGGIVLFIWGAVAHMALPIGEMGMKVATNQDAALAAVSASATPGAGVYMLPGMSPEEWSNEAARATFAEKAKASPYAFVVYQPGGNPVNVTMGPALAKQFVGDTLVALLVAWLMALAPFAFGRRVLIGTVVGVASWLAISVPYWNWYMFPTDFTLGTLLDVVLGLLIASMPMAWWLGRARR